MHRKAWKNAKVAIMPKYFLGLFMFLGVYSSMLPKALESSNENAPWNALILCALSGIIFELVFHPVFNWYIVRFGFLKAEGFLPTLGDNEDPLVIGGSISPRATVFLTSERIVIRIPGPIQED